MGRGVARRLTGGTEAKGEARGQRFTGDVEEGGRHVVGAQVCRLSSLVYALMSIVFFFFSLVMFGWPACITIEGVCLQCSHFISIRLLSDIYFTLF
ncbi:hypothetical protein PVAP13_2KG014300 [Panicum virgatum]|uniref:Transmembrane protein n=1 Tax=Panicum virgatum TaxID=38727 RepID=A0A8T0W1Y6_PANVG|nr:hypothetical protein PVAP13_2KG014300 [Panicum virgatum]